MIDLQTARELITNMAPLVGVETVNLSQAVGRILREEISSDIDSPPHNKALVDGYAVVAKDTSDPAKRANLQVLEEVAAGSLPTLTVTPGKATRVMTGAPIPAGADAMVMVEDTKLAHNGKSVAITTSVTKGAAILPQGAVMNQGDVVLKSGVKISAAQIGLLAEVGRTSISTSRKISISILSTGNELILADEAPTAGRIRNSNGPMLAALASELGASVIDLGIVSDDESSLTDAIRNGLQSDILLVSGGVSAGVLDLTPAALAACGVNEVFHKLNLRPGKPLWFGVHEGGDQRSLVFGLPGNPVSGFVCFHLLVKHAIVTMIGAKSPTKSRKAYLGDGTMRPSSRETYWPAVYGAGNVVQILNWKGSADLVTLAHAECLVRFPTNTKLVRGDAVDVIDI